MSRLVHPVCLLILTAVLLSPRPAAAQSEGWKVDLYPLYFWAMSLNGDINVRSATVPVDLAFSDAAENLAGAFSFHVEASRGRWGTLIDLNFMRLSTDADFTVAARPVTADFELDNIMFEAGASYLVHQPAALAVSAACEPTPSLPRSSSRRRPAAPRRWTRA